MRCWRRVRPTSSTRGCYGGRGADANTGYKEYDTGRTYLAKMGDWRLNKDEEVNLDGIGGVNILVKADVHRTGTFFPPYAILT